MCVLSSLPLLPLLPPLLLLLLLPLPHADASAATKYHVKAIDLPKRTRHTRYR